MTDEYKEILFNVRQEIFETGEILRRAETDITPAYQLAEILRDTLRHTGDDHGADHWHEIYQYLFTRYCSAAAPIGIIGKNG